MSKKVIVEVSSLGQISISHTMGSNDEAMLLLEAARSQLFIAVMDSRYQQKLIQG